MAKKRRNGDGSIFQTGDGQWIAKYPVRDELTGKSKPMRRRARSRDHARELLAEMKATKGKGSLPTTGITFAEYLSQWRDETLPIQDRAASTKAIYHQCLTYYGTPAAGGIALARLTPSACEQWLSLDPPA